MSDAVKEKSESPLSIKNLAAGIIVTVLGGLILAYIIQDARFSDKNSTNNEAQARMLTRTPSTITTIIPNSTQIVNSTTIIAIVEEDKTVDLYNGKIFISINSVNLFAENISATIGAPGCANQKISEAPIGYAVMYECNKKYDVRVGGINNQSGWWTSSQSVEFYISELEN